MTTRTASKCTYSSTVLNICIFYIHITKPGEIEPHVFKIFSFIDCVAVRSSVRKKLFWRRMSSRCASFFIFFFIMQQIKRNKNLRSVAIIIIVSVMACSSSSSITTSLLSSPSTSYWSRSCCSGGALGRSCFTISRLILGASFIRSLLRIWDLIAFNLIVLICCRTSQVEHCSVSSGLVAEGCWCVSWSLKTTGPKAISKLRYSTI